ncbi:MAG: hypothetical protein E7286_01755 [Lachnospiraceae bacterium]|nr:hypothetical protein [Lachnospiraceae bacterium]
MKKLLKYKKYLLYVICFAFLCIIDQRKGSVTGNMQYFWSNCTGLAIALLIFSHYNIRDFLKKPYLIWLFIGILGIAGCLTLQKMGMVFPWDNVQLYSAIANIFIYGFLVIRTILDLSGKPLNIKKFWFPGYMCLLFVLMGASRNDSIWPWYFLLVFGTFAFTDFSETERKNLSFAFADGIIVGFLCVQGCAFVFRPYDVIRYLGMYANSNINALFYSIVYCAVLVRLFFFMFEYSGKCKKLLISFAMFMCGAMWSFCMLTGCRTALLSMGIVTCVAGALCLFRFNKRILLKGTGMIIGLACCVIASFPIVYGCVRYIPALFHHPIWFYVEYSEAKVHSWDPVDSEKYVDFDEILEYIQKRLFGVTLFEKETTALIEKNYGFPLLCSAAELTHIEVQPEPLLPPTDDSTILRYHIFKYYLSQLNMVGHLAEENGIYITLGYVAPHAHNMYLQQAFDFGVPIGILFVGHIVLSMIHLLRKGIRFKNSYNWGLLLLFVNSCVFGLLEMMWKNGYLAFTIIFLTTIIAGRQQEKKRQDEMIQ